MRDKYLSNIISEIHSDPKAFSFIQYVFWNPQRILNKYLLLYTNDEKFIVEKHTWDWNQEFRNLTFRKNLSLLEKGEYISELKKNSIEVNKETVLPILDKVRNIHITPGDFDFSNIMILDGLGYDLRIKSYSYNIKTTWRIPPENWPGLEELTDELILIVETALKE